MIADEFLSTEEFTYGQEALASVVAETGYQVLTD